MPDDNPQLPPLTLGRSMWAIQPEVLPRLVEAHRRGPAALDRLGIRAAAAAPVAARRNGSRAGGSVAIIPLTGVITTRYSFLSFLFGGGGGLIDFREAFREALNSPDVGAIVLDVDSPGGQLDLVPETAAEIYAARGEKPIVAVANTMMASAAYYIASQADEIVITPSGVAGSIGVYMVHEDWSKFNEDFGVIPTYVSAGKYKIEGNPDHPLDDEAKADWQGEVDYIYDDFVAAIAQARGVTTDQVTAGYGEGRTLRARPAVDAGVVDRIDTIEDVVSDLLGNAGTTSTARAARVHQERPAPVATAGDDDEQEPPADDEELEPDEPPANEPDDEPDNDDEPDDGEGDKPEPVGVSPEERAAIAALLI